MVRSPIRAHNGRSGGAAVTHAGLGAALPVLLPQDQELF